MNILVIEDDVVIGKSLHKGLQEAGLTCTLAHDGPRGLDLAVTGHFDVLILDLLLPGKSGLEVLRDLRDSGIRTPVILLTALGSVEERVVGLRAGADDYMVKPFALAELLARLEAVARRTQKPAPRLEAGPLALDLTTRRVTCHDAEVNLTPTEFSLLEMLMRHAGQVVTRSMLCEHLWAADWEGETNVIEVHVNRLRSKLQRAGFASLIQTVRGRGYAFQAP